MFCLRICCVFVGVKSDEFWREKFPKILHSLSLSYARMNARDKVVHSKT
jgi:hypothetical protein